jgi:predicted CopG family antitoxin
MECAVRMPKTTIQLSEDTKNRLESLKRVDGESYESVLLMVIAHYNNTSKEPDTLTEPDVEAIVEREIERLRMELR